jgi:hypothetical protein
MRVNRYHIMGNGSDGKRVIVEAFTGTRTQARERARAMRTKALNTWVSYIGGADEVS